MLTILKIILSLPVAYGLAYPLLVEGAKGGILGEIQMFGPYVASVVVVIFLGLIFLYCRDLSKSLSLVSPAARKATPKSVWLMFLIPYNFIEDFFIVVNVAKSLEGEAKTNPALQGFKHFGMISGLGWCIAQIISLIPHELGSVAGLVAIILWVIHWRFIRKINTVLSVGAVSRNELIW